MKKLILSLLMIILSISSFAEKTNFKIHITEGKHWIHKFKVMPLIKVKTRPQMAFWLEDINGNYIETIFVTSKSAEQSWSKAPGDDKEITRNEALPVWEHKSGFRENKDLDTDGVAGATPNKTKHSDIIGSIDDSYDKVYLYAEINHSTDFNDSYPKKAKADDPNYSGGKYGSGQPSMIYRVMIDKNKLPHRAKMKLLGSGQPAGKDGKIYDLKGITSAKDIVKSINVIISK